MRSSLTVLGFFSLSIFVTPVSAQNISPAEQDGIKSTCSWKWTANGPADYYRCVGEKTQALQRTPRPDLSDINSSDREAIKSTCSWKWNANGPADYYQCVDSKARELRGTSQPSVSGISSSDLEGIKSTCFWKWNANGPADYYQCVDSKARELRGTSQPSVSHIDDKTPAEPRPSKEQNGFISSIQGVMGILGYYEGKPNGTYDQQTLDAIRTYQKDRGLSPDDTIGAATRNELVKDIALALNGNRAPPSPAPIQGGGSSSELGGAILDYKGLVVPPVAENGSYYGELNANGVPKTVHVDGYYRKDGTYVRGHYRSAPGTNPHKPH